VQKIKKMLNWHPKYDNLDAIISSALAWEKRKLK
jgi:UDP-glucose 4-epimerase